MWGHLLHHIVSMLIMSTSQTETFFDELFQLTVRHIRYGVKSHYMPPFGKALIETFEEIAGEEWTEETAVAWQEVWNRAADSMMRGLNFGASPLVHALVDGSIGQLKLAVSEFPREARALKLCQIAIESTQVSPIVWALHDGNVELAAFIIKDLLTIRADLHGYYYGRDMLFKYHPDIVGMLGRDHPQLMGPLLDGLLWHSREKTDRKVRVSYFIAELFGNPNQFQDPWTSPLARLVEYADNKTIGHPVVNKLLEIKWRKFGLKLFCLQEGWYLLPLVLYMVEHNLSDEHSDDSLDCHSYTRVNLRRTLVAFAIINIIVQVCAWGQQLHDKKVKAAELWGWRISVPRTASNWWLWLRVASWFVLIVVYSGHDCEEFSGNFSPCFALENGSYVPETCWADSSSVIFAEGNMTSSVHRADDGLGLEWVELGGVQQQRAMVALAGMILWVQVLECSILSQPMAAFTFSLGIMISDLSHSLFFMVLLVLSFGSALSFISDEPYADGLDATIVTLIKEVVGKGANQEVLSPLSSMLQISFISAVTIFMLNVLIAQLSLTYGRVMTFARPSMLKYRASVCLDIESLLPQWMRQRVYDSLGFDDPLPLSFSDSGPAGGVQVWQSEAGCTVHAPFQRTKHARIQASTAKRVTPSCAGMGVRGGLCWLYSRPHSALHWGRHASRPLAQARV